jgi:hypothetical protein
MWLSSSLYQGRPRWRQCPASPKGGIPPPPTSPAVLAFPRCATFASINHMSTPALRLHPIDRHNPTPHHWPQSHKASPCAGGASGRHNPATLSVPVRLKPRVTLPLAASRLASIHRRHWKDHLCPWVDFCEFYKKMITRLTYLFKIMSKI